MSFVEKASVLLSHDMEYIPKVVSPDLKVKARGEYK